MKKKGISLIVLVITIVVIIILAAAVIIALGQNNPIGNARVAAVSETKNSITDGITMYASSIKARTLGEYSMKEMLIDKDEYKVVGSTTKTVTEDGVPKILYILDKAKAKTNLNVELKDDNWYIDEKGKVYLVYDNEASIPSYLKDGDNVSSALSNTITYNGAVSYKVGDAVTIEVDGNNETFFVIDDSSICDLTLKLITKENINTTTLTQTSANTIAFSESSYWWDSTNDKILDKYNTPNGLNVDIGSIQSTDGKYALYAAQEYGKKLGGIGRLLLKSEADILLILNSDLLYAHGGIFQSANGFSNYWLSSAIINENTNIWYVMGWGSGVLASAASSYSSGIGVRPVITISKSKI